MQFIKSAIEDLWVITLQLHEDERGFFGRTYCEREFLAHGLNTKWPQHNLTRTRQVGCVRGMHWQASPAPEIKLIHCIRGAIWDCIVDVRPHSKTYGKWQGFELSGENQRMLYAGAGLAHGFQVLEENSEVFYQMSEFYQGALARGIRHDDPDLKIHWPLDVTMLSERDRFLPAFASILNQPEHS